MAQLSTVSSLNTFKSSMIMSFAAVENAFSMTILLRTLIVNW
ncbi:hypothetical protein NC652_013758 [Populus alba x Populus x berolinensis]|uniref:Uncharacterized protein n=1 Tax=Populus alba x Populus x berolinensis TaxID=444605 RepID=A0AAD6QV44_9ROSI|nr:hypothetical protein NC652_013758 [Populus alba x Populus x berolinensis]KAJ6997244.1 hypothetical protein NC653_013728 [Populus alba x Populus x berolinensis]